MEWDSLINKYSGMVSGLMEHYFWHVLAGIALFIVFILWMVAR